MIEIIHGDYLEVMRGMADNTVDLIATDPPYFKVKGAQWDRQWDNADAFLEWIGRLCEEWHRLLKPNGSLYVFASPKMAARVECKIAEWLNVLNRITWRKPPFGTKAEMCRKADLRSFFPASEGIIFAAHYEFVFEPLRAYLDEEREKAGLSPEEANEICGHRRQGGMAGRHYFSASQWGLPTAGNYAKLQSTDFFRRPYEDLRREYEDLRRPFAVSADVPYTDVWDFPTVQVYPGKHPCEKPVEMMEHIIRMSSRPGALVLDCFAGSGTTGVAALRTGRRAVLIEREEEYVEIARRRVAAEEAGDRQGRLFV